MDHSGLEARGGSWLHPGLLHWQWVRHRQLYLFCLTLSVGFLTVLVLQDLHKLAWSRNSFLITGLWAAYLGSANAVWNPDKADAFLLARPVSRRQAYDILLLEGMVPWLLLGAVPALYVLVVSLGRALWSSPNLTASVVFYLVYIIWTLAFYLTTIYLTVSGKAAPKKAATNIQGIAWLLLIILATSTTGFWTSEEAMMTVFTYAPLLAVVGLALAVWSYRAGWRLYRNLDL
ncbi:MAG TPA: hypothetical protein VMW83_15020 [Spirochaetia bacterium]|nr:hypothetical protein [Spirochaetia bacterium]